MEMVARIFRNILDALFGNAQRVQGTLIVAGLAMVYFHPGMLRQVLGQLFAEVQPFLPMAIMAGGIYIILFGRGRGGKKR